MLIYSHAFDLSHCIFRMLFILNILDDQQCLEIEKARIIDFYLAYPGIISEFKFPVELIKYKNNFSEINKKYRDPINSRATFEKMSILQKKALSTLVSMGYIDVSIYKKGKIKRTLKKIPLDLLEKLNSFSFYGNNAQPKQILLILMSIHLKGQDGLKYRSNLMEYRYEIN